MQLQQLIGMMAISVLIAASCGVASTGLAQDNRNIDLEAPADDAYVVDRAELIDKSEEAQIESNVGQLRMDGFAPIYVVTIESMADHWPHGDIRIETFAHLLFDQWAIGDPALGEPNWNRGILLLVSKDDRKARIQLGAGWERAADLDAQRIMDRYIIPHFKQGDFEKGISVGVQAIDQMARGELKLNSGERAGEHGPSIPMPASNPPSPWSSIGMFTACGLFFVAAIVVVLLLRRSAAGSEFGASGLQQPAETGSNSSGFLAGLLAGQMFNMGGGSSGSGGGFSGGSFGGGFSGGGFSGGGGGFSGGGGATGGW